MYKPAFNQMKLKEDKNSIATLNATDQLKVSKEDHTSEHLMHTLNFLGNGAYREELNFFQLDNL